jgi:hypothetical protein
MLTYNSFAPALEHRDIFPTEAAFASAILAAFIGAFGTLIGSIAGLTVGLFVLKRSTRSRA